MSSLNFADQDVSPKDPATAWDGEDPNTIEVSWWDISPILASNPLGALRPMAELPQWWGIQNPVTPLTELVVDVSMQLLNNTKPPASDMSAITTDPDIHATHQTIQ